jgi:hypothetical protein
MFLITRICQGLSALISTALVVINVQAFKHTPSDSPSYTLLWTNFVLISVGLFGKIPYFTLQIGIYNNFIMFVYFL